MKIRKAFEEDVEEIIKIRNGKYVKSSNEKIKYFIHILNNYNLYVIEKEKIIGYLAFEELSKKEISLEEFDLLKEYKTKKTFNQLFKQFNRIVHYVNIENKEMIQFLKENNFKIKNKYDYVYYDVEKEKILTKVYRFISSKLGFMFLNQFNYRFANQKDLDLLINIRLNTPEFEDEIKNIEEYYKKYIDDNSIFIFSDKKRNSLGYIVFKYTKDDFCNIIDLLILPQKRGKKNIMFMMAAFMNEIFKKGNLKLLSGMILDSNKRMLGIANKKFGAKLEGKYYLMEKN